MEAPSILVDERDLVTLRFVTSLLRERGFRILTPQPGQHPLELALLERPDLILTDLAPQSGDINPFLRLIRSHPEICDIPVVVLSQRDREEDIVRGFEEGADDYIVRPFRALELVARIRSLLRRARKSA